MTARTTRTVRGDFNLGVARLQEDCRKLAELALDLGDADARIFLRSIGSDIGEMIRQLAERDSAVVA